MDKYDKQIERILAYSGRSLEFEWMTGVGLFQYVTPTGDFCRRPDELECGCLTLVHSQPDCVAWTDELTELIRADDRLPMNSSEMVHRWDQLDLEGRRALLGVFAEWQRRLDREIRNAA